MVFQPGSQGPFSTSRKYFLEVEKGPWEPGWWFSRYVIAAILVDENKRFFSGFIAKSVIIVGSSVPKPFFFDVK